MKKFSGRIDCLQGSLRRCFPTVQGKRLSGREPILLLCFWLVVLSRDADGWLCMSLLASVLHELGHVAVYRLLVGQWPELFVGFTGICMHTHGKALPTKKELWITLAGPAVNVVLSLGCRWWMDWAGATVRGWGWLWCNALLAGFNLLPVPPLDGWHILWLLCRR